MCMQRKALGSNWWAAKTMPVEFCNTEDVHEVPVNAPLLVADICHDGLAAAGVAVVMKQALWCSNLTSHKAAASTIRIAMQVLEMKLSLTRH